MTLFRRFTRNLGLIAWQAAIIEQQQQLIADQTHTIRRMTLDHARDMQGMVSGWLIHIERPEMDVRDALAEMEADLTRRIAVLEEYVV